VDDGRHVKYLSQVYCHLPHGPSGVSRWACMGKTRPAMDNEEEIDRIQLKHLREAHCVGPNDPALAATRKAAFLPKGGVVPLPSYDLLTQADRASVRKGYCPAFCRQYGADFWKPRSLGSKKIDVEEGEKRVKEEEPDELDGEESEGEGQIVKEEVSDSESGPSIPGDAPNNLGEGGD
jgi:hypothetical protein